MEGLHMGHAMRTPAVAPLTPPPALGRVQEDLKRRLAGKMVLWSAERGELAGPGGELDQAMPMPGWTNVWTCLLPASTPPSVSASWAAGSTM
jgi:hypothetical protein